MGRKNTQSYQLISQYSISFFCGPGIVDQVESWAFIGLIESPYIYMCPFCVTFPMGLFWPLRLVRGLHSRHWPELIFKQSFFILLLLQLQVVIAAPGVNGSAGLQGGARAVSVKPHPLIVDKIVRAADLNSSFLAIAFEGEADGIDIPFQTGVLTRKCSPGCPERGLILPRVRIFGPDRKMRRLEIPTRDLHEIVGASIVRRVSAIGVERLIFSNKAMLEIVAPRSDPRILMYVEDVKQGSQVAELWDVWVGY